MIVNTYLRKLIKIIKYVIIILTCAVCNNAKSDKFTYEEFKRVSDVIKEIWQQRKSKPSQSWQTGHHLSSKIARGDFYGAEFQLPVLSLYDEMLLRSPKVPWLRFSSILLHLFA